MKSYKTLFINRSIAALAVAIAGIETFSGTVVRVAHAEPWQTNVKNVKVTLTKNRLTFVESGKTTTVTADGIVFLKKGSRLNLHGRDDTPDRYRLIGKYHIVTPEGNQYDGIGADLHVIEFPLKEGAKKNVAVVFPFGNMESHPTPDVNGKKQPYSIVPGKLDRTVCITFALVP